MTTGFCSAIRSKERPPRPEQLRLLAGRHGLQAQQSRQPRLDPASLLGIGHEVRHAGGQQGAGLLGVSALGDAGPLAGHLGQGPEADPLPVGRGASRVPVGSLAKAVEVLLELPGQPVLPDSCLTDDRDEAGLPFAGGGVEQVADEAEVVVAAHERRLEGRLAAGPAPHGLHVECLPGGDVLGFPLQRLLPDRFVGDGLVGRPPRGLPDQDRSGRRGALQPRCGVDQVAGDHGLARGANGGGRLAGQDRSSKGEGCAGIGHGADGRDQVQGRADRAFGVVLVGDRDTPDGHHRIANELLDRAAVAANDLIAGVEIAGQQVARLLRVAVLGQGG